MQFLARVEFQERDDGSFHFENWMRVKVLVKGMPELTGTLMVEIGREPKPGKTMETEITLSENTPQLRALNPGQELYLFDGEHMLAAGKVSLVSKVF